MCITPAIIVQLLYLISFCLCCIGSLGAFLARPIGLTNVLTSRRSARAATFLSDVQSPADARSPSAHSPPASPVPPNPPQQSEVQERVDTVRDVIFSRRNCRTFLPKEVPLEVLTDLMTAAQRAPSGFNMQPWVCILVREASVRERLAATMLGEKNRSKIKEAPVVAVFCADLESQRQMPRIVALIKKDRERRLAYRATQASSKSPQKPPAKSKSLQRIPFYVSLFAGALRGWLIRYLWFLIRYVIFAVLRVFQPLPVPSMAETWAYKNTMLAVQTYMLLASAYGLGTAPMEGFDMVRLRRVLMLPDRFSVPLVVATGYPADAPISRTYPLLSGRLPMDEQVFSDFYDRRLAI
mmetsp:Transcript_52869/g.132887  ORF Transcript_52869/g.132887 Transcript_52869/m.132887 type:complete len:353 (+) Transcript_52869:65-1123(+)